MMKTILIIIFFAIFISSCEREIDLKIPPHEKKLVINAQWAQNRFFTARVTKSWGLTETFSNLNEQFRVTNAFVTVKEDGVVIDTLKYDSLNDRYSSNKRRTSLARTYVIEASSPQLSKASGTSSVPYLVRPISTLVKRNARINLDGQPETEIIVTFKDSSVLNYYVIRVRSQDGNFYSCVKSADRDIEKLGASNPFEINACIDGDKILFTDRNFNGRDKKFVFYVPDYLLEGVRDPNTGRTQRSWIEILHVNEDYFRYIKSVRNYSDVQGNPFAEPVNVVNNIQNGYGFFATYAIAVDTLR
jgi:Domain of unknown function (DUF4249)